MANFYAYTELDMRLTDSGVTGPPLYVYGTPTTETIAYKSYDGSVYCEATGRFDLYSPYLSDSYVYSMDFWLYNAYSLHIGEINMSAEAISNISESSDMFPTIFSGDDVLVGGKNETYSVALMGYDGKDHISGTAAGDWLHGQHGSDTITGYSGNDVIRGGHGHDYLDGDSGADYLWGGIGANWLSAGDDYEYDDLIVPADRVNNLTNGNPGGLNADLLFEVGPEDRIWVHGVSDSTLTYADNIFHPLDSSYEHQGIGIYSNGVLEAVVVSDRYSITTERIDEITTGGFF